MLRKRIFNPSFTKSFVQCPSTASFWLCLFCISYPKWYPNGIQRYPNLNQKRKKKLQTSQNKCLCFCQILNKMAHTSPKELKTLIWLSARCRFNQCVSSMVFTMSVACVPITWMKFLKLLPILVLSYITVYSSNYWIKLTFIHWSFIVK